MLCAESVVRRGERPRRPRPSSADPAAVDQRRARSLEEPLDVQLRTIAPYPLLEVRNPIHGTSYLVMLPEFPGRGSALCTCTDFARRGLGTCKHIEAGVRWLPDHPQADPLRPNPPESTGQSAIWKKIDQRAIAALKETTPNSRRWRRAGATLYERPTEST